MHATDALTVYANICLGFVYFENETLKTVSEVNKTCIPFRSSGLQTQSYGQTYTVNSAGNGTEGTLKIVSLHPNIVMNV